VGGVHRGVAASACLVSSTASPITSTAVFLTTMVPGLMFLRQSRRFTTDIDLMPG
jgi:hypothetical protein